MNHLLWQAYYNKQGHIPVKIPLTWFYSILFCCSYWFLITIYVTITYIRPYVRPGWWQDVLVSYLHGVIEGIHVTRRGEQCIWSYQCDVLYYVLTCVKIFKILLLCQQPFAELTFVKQIFTSRKICMISFAIAIIQIIEIQDKSSYQLFYWYKVS